MPYDTPVQSYYFFLFPHKEKDVGIHSFTRLLSEAYHSPRWLTSRVIPTYILNIYPIKCA